MQKMVAFLRWLRARRGPVLLVPRRIDGDGGVALATGDVLLVRSPVSVTEPERLALTASFERAMPRRVRVVVVGPGVDFDVLTAAPVEREVE